MNAPGPDPRRQADPSAREPPTLAPKPVEIDVCICSYKRAEVVETLAAIARQQGARRFRVVVADNTIDSSGRQWAMRAAAQFRLDIDYVHAPADNISVARNACLDAARGTWIAFVDDDELPARNWLASLLSEAERGDWTAVLGPVIALYRDGAQPWLRRGDFHSVGPVWRNNEIVTAYTGNVLFRREFAQRLGLRFRIDLGTSGGEDEDFFCRLRDGGGRIGFAPDAVCYERVGAERARMGWLLRRNFRAGQSHASRLRRKTARQLLVALGKASFCGAGAALSLPDAARRNRWLVRAALHCGVAARLAGLAEIDTYRSSARGAIERIK